MEIPKRALFKAAEVCDLAKVQPYVLRSWEAEFPELGIARSPGSARTYRRQDVERVLRIKHLLLVEGLTLAGARRRLEDEDAPVAADEPIIDELLGRNARERLTAVKQGLRAILDLLAPSRRDGLRLAPASAAAPLRRVQHPVVAAARSKSSGSKSAAKTVAKPAAARTAHARRAR